jgi:hypothetical protein
VALVVRMAHLGEDLRTKGSTYTNLGEPFQPLGQGGWFGSSLAYTATDTAGQTGVESSTKGKTNAGLGNWL